MYYYAQRTEFRVLKKEEEEKNKQNKTNKNSTLNRFEINFFDSESDEERGRF